MIVLIEVYHSSRNEATHFRINRSVFGYELTLKLVMVSGTEDDHGKTKEP